MAIVRTSTGNFLDIGAGGTISPTLPRDVANEIAIILTGEVIGTDTLATPAGWTLLTDPANAQQCAAFGKVLVGSDSMPSFSWGSQLQWALVLTYSGAQLAAGFTPEGRATSGQTTNIPGVASSHTPSQNGCLVLEIGQKNKTAASNGTSFSPNNLSLVKQDIFTGVGYGVCIAESIQTTAITIPAFSTINGTVADATGQLAQTHLFCLLPAASPVIPRPPLNNGGMIVQVAQ